MNAQTLFQRAELRKRYREEIYDSSEKIRRNFIETYNQLINQSLSATLLNSRKTLLRLKNKLIIDIQESIYNILVERMDKNYSKYIEFLLESFRKNSMVYDNAEEVEFIFSPKDFDYFSKNIKQIESIVQKKVILKNAGNQFLGGFKISLSKGIIIYDYTNRNLIEKNTSSIQVEISKMVDDSIIKEIEYGFEEFIEDKKLKIDEFLRNYDNI